MNMPQIFNFDNHSVRTIQKDDEIWFVAKDVAEILGYTNPQKAVRDHCKSVVSVGVNESFTLDPQTSIIPERDLYRMVMRSKLPSAEKFEEWIVADVIPSIRKTGSYTPPATPEMQIANAILLAGRMIEEQKFQIEQRDKLIAIAAPKAAIADRIMVSDGLFGFRQVAKKLELNERKFKQWLISNNWVYTLGGRMTVKSDILKKGFAETKDTLIQVAGEQEKLVVDMYFTSKGVHKLAQIFGVVTESN